VTSYSVDPQNLGDKGAASGLTLAGFALMALGGSDMADYRKDADRCYELARQMAKPEDLHAADYCFGGNRDCGGETCIGLDESCVETCAGCCAGFGSGVWTGSRGEDESRAMLCWEICSWMRVS